MATAAEKKPPDRRQREAAGRPVVTFERDGQTVYLIDPPRVGALDALATVRHELVSRGGRGAALVRSPEPLVGRPDDLSLFNFRAGLVPAVNSLLVAGGYAVHYRDVTSPEPVPLSEPDLAAAGRLGVVDAGFLDFIHRHGRGVVTCGAGVDPFRLAAQAALAFPAATFAVVATRVGDVRRFHERYRRVVPGLSWATAESCPATVGRVVVATPFGLAHNGITFRERDVVVALDAAGMPGERAQVALGDAALGKLFALTPRGRPVAPRDRDRLAPLFGFDSVVVPRHGCVERPVAVAFARVDGGPRPAPDPGGVDLLRRGVWEHPVRNRRVARLAGALAVGDRASIVKEFPGLASAADGLPAYPVVVVLAGGLEHALALADGLPGWPLVVGPDVTTHGLPPRLAGLLGRARWAGPGDPGVAVVTAAGLGSVDLGVVDVVVRADGGVGVPPGLASIPVPAGADVRPLVLVDLADRHHPELRRRSRARRDAYSGLGWAVDGVPAPSPVERFLASRPGGPR